MRDEGIVRGTLPLEALRFLLGEAATVDTDLISEALSQQTQYLCWVAACGIL